LWIGLSGFHPPAALHAGGKLSGAPLFLGIQLVFSVSGKLAAWLLGIGVFQGCYRKSRGRPRHSGARWSISYLEEPFRARPGKFMLQAHLSRRSLCKLLLALPVALPAQSQLEPPRSDVAKVAAGADRSNDSPVQLLHRFGCQVDFPNSYLQFLDIQQTFKIVATVNLER
jgi:hypothetical protein